jgi:hypothetical protein
MTCHRKSLIAILSVASLFYLGGLNLAWAEEMSPKKHELILSYLKRAFAYGKSQTLTKFDTVDEIPFRYECGISDKQACAPFIFSINDAIRETRFFVIKESQQPKLSIIIVDAENADRARQELLKTLNSEGFADTSDPECQVFVSISNSTIVKSSIVVAIEQSSLKQKICATSQLSRALGMSNPANGSFSEIWNAKPRGYQSLDSDGYANVRQSNTILNHIHMCPALMVGMTLKEVIAVLSLPANICMTELKGI